MINLDKMLLSPVELNTPRKALIIGRVSPKRQGRHGESAIFGTATILQVYS